MIEAALVTTILELLEGLAIPLALGWASSEAVGISKSKHNSIGGMMLGVVKAVVREVAEQQDKPQSPPEVVSSAVVASEKIKSVITPKPRKTPQRGPKGRFQKAKDC